MNVTIISKSDNEVEVRIEGESHTLLGVLKDALLRIDEVEAATYDVNPESSGRKTSPVLYTKTDGLDPIDAIEQAAEIVGEEAEEFRELYTDAAAT